MEKLIELLNEYQYGMFVYENDLLLLRIGSNVKVGGETFVISKKFGFIKWLVENDKIDKKKIDTRLVRNVESHYNEDGYWVENSYGDYSDINTLLMLLSISDTPIKDLILYLK